jgi:hypothetical protein
MTGCTSTSHLLTFVISSRHDEGMEVGELKQLSSEKYETMMIVKKILLSSGRRVVLLTFVGRECGVADPVCCWMALFCGIEMKNERTQMISYVVTQKGMERSG